MSQCTLCNAKQSQYAVAEVPMCIAEGPLCIAEGPLCIAEGSLCIAEGPLCIAEGSLCIAEGSLCITEGLCVNCLRSQQMVNGTGPFFLHRPNVSPEKVEQLLYGPTIKGPAKKSMEGLPNKVQPIMWSKVKKLGGLLFCC